MNITLQEFAAGVDFKVTTLGNDAYLSVMRLGLLLGISRTGAQGSLVTTEEFTFFKPYDPNNRPALTDVLESWIEDCKSAALEKFYRRLTAVTNTAEMAEANKITEEVTKAKKSRANLKAVAPITEEPQTPAVKEPEVKVEPQAAPTIAAEQAEAVSAPVTQPEIVKYEKSNKDHARLVQGWLDLADSTWKRDARSVEWARSQLIPAIHGVLEILIDGKENILAKSKLISAFTQKDLALLK